MVVAATAAGAFLVGMSVGAAVTLAAVVVAYVTAFGDVERER